MGEVLFEHDRAHDALNAFREALSMFDALGVSRACIDLSCNIAQLQVLVGTPSDVVRQYIDAHGRCQLDAERQTVRQRMTELLDRCLENGRADVGSELSRTLAGFSITDRYGC